MTNHFQVRPERSKQYCLQLYIYILYIYSRAITTLHKNPEMNATTHCTECALLRFIGSAFQDY